MKHLGWKIVFGISWIPGFFLYGNLVTGLIAMGKPEGIESLREV